MAAQTSDRLDTQESSMGPPPVRTLLFSMLSLLVEVSAHHVGAGVPNVGGDSNTDRAIDLHEARLAIDAANALIQSVGRALSSDERLALEGLLTQLQVEYVKRSGS
jgi:hypothetical protein